MPEPISFEKLEFNLVGSMGQTRGALDAETPFQILVMGDFSGRTNQGQDRPSSELKELKPLGVDRDTIDTLIAKLGVTVHLPIYGENAPPISISFSELDDFHPDALFQRLPVFQAFKETRKSLKDPSTFAAVTEALLKEPSPVKDPPLPEPEGQKPSQDMPSGDLLDQIIENSSVENQATAPAARDHGWDSFVHNIVKPHLVPKAHPRQEEMMDAVDTAAEDLMQRILHHVDFQAMESAWQGLYFLVSRLETDSLLTLSLVDISKNELASDLFATDDLRRTALYKLWHDPAGGIPGGRPWSVVAGNFFFGKQDKDLELLGRTAKIAAAAGICFVGGAGDRFVCENSLAETPDPDDWNPSPDKGTHDKWLELRHLSEASYIGLALPRMLLRLPYGEETDPIDAFHFEEMPIPGAHKDYLWGNPCFALILLMGQAFSLQGRQMQPGAVLEINSLPLHVLKKDGQSHLTPCAETLLSMRAAEQILENGLMPLVSFLNQDKIRIGRFQSIAEPLARLSGPWD